MFAAFYSNNLRLLPDEVYTNWVADMMGLQMSYNDLMDAPALFVNWHLFYLHGKIRAENKKNEDAAKRARPKPKA